MRRYYGGSGGYIFVLRHDALAVRSKTNPRNLIVASYVCSFHRACSVVCIYNLCVFFYRGVIVCVFVRENVAEQNSSRGFLGVKIAL